MSRNFAGFGCGPIQTALMLLEAQASGNFSLFTVAEIDPTLVDAVRANRNRITVNIAHEDGIEKKTVSHIEILNPGIDTDRKRMAAAISEADELATALPDVNTYTSGGDSSAATLLARNINPEKPQIIYACENNNFAAEILKERILALAPAARLSNLQILNTVIGKMSGVVTDPEVIRKLGLETMTPAIRRAVLAEEFNRILVSRVTLPGAKAGIEIFEQKQDLLPFEEAKLFGHNAVHALLGYLGFLKGLRTMHEVGKNEQLMDIGRKAFVDESGQALVRKHGRLGEELFTPGGYAAYADDLLKRMTNPYLNDEIARVCRDPLRKLGYNDRLVGAIREVLKQDIAPSAFALGAAAAVRYITANNVCIGTGPVPCVEPGRPSAGETESILAGIWKDAETDDLKNRCTKLIVEAGQELDTMF